MCCVHVLCNFPPACFVGCTGKRSRTGFVPLTEFDERVLLSDYRFLEEAAAAGDAAQRVAPGERRAVPPQHARELVHQVGAGRGFQEI